MSGSPKHCRATLSAEQLAAIEAERKRLAEIEAQRRRAEEEARQRERLARAQRQATKDADALLSDLGQLSQGNLQRFIATELRDCQAQVQRLKSATQGATNERDVQRLQGELGELPQQVTALKAKAEALMLSERMSDADRRRTLVRKRFETLRERDCWKYDAAGFQAVRDQLAGVQQALDLKQPAAAEARLAQAEQSLEQHLVAVAAGRRAQADRKAAANHQIDRAADTLAGLAADAVMTRWMPAEMQALQARCRRAQEFLAAEQYDAVAAESQAVLSAAPELVSRAQHLQLQQDKRDYIVAGIRQVMQQLQFEVNEPTYEVSGDPRSAVVIQSSRPSGQPLAVSVPIEGEIWYAVDNQSIRLSQGTQGEVVSTCDDAEAQIAAVHRNLASQFGIDMSQLQWDAPTPELIDQVAMQLPESLSQSEEHSASMQARANVD